jgi:hypothetical protein
MTEEGLIDALSSALLPLFVEQAQREKALTERVTGLAARLSAIESLAVTLQAQLADAERRDRGDQYLERYAHGSAAR